MVHRVAKRPTPFSLLGAAERGHWSPQSEGGASSPVGRGPLLLSLVIVFIFRTTKNTVPLTEIYGNELRQMLFSLMETSPEYVPKARLSTSYGSSTQCLML